MKKSGRKKEEASSVMGRGRNKGGAFGPGGSCICLKCGKILPHERGVKCTRIECPECGSKMVREELVNSKSKQKSK
jgi:DNA-directed RNA polymerase subunit RPC12/RpoP